jgi:hypothetical protein
MIRQLNNFAHPRGDEMGRKGSFRGVIHTVCTKLHRPRLNPGLIHRPRIYPQSSPHEALDNRPGMTRRRHVTCEKRSLWDGREQGGVPGLQKRPHFFVHHIVPMDSPNGLWNGSA